MGRESRVRHRFIFTGKNKIIKIDIFGLGFLEI